MAKYVTEFIGTFFLVFAIGLAVLSDSALAPLAIGLALVALVYMGGHVSGAHYNPAVSIAFLVRGKMEAKDLAPYIIAQVVGAVLASVAVGLILGKTFAPAPAATVSMTGALLTEVLFTFILVLVILNVATAKATESNGYYGLAIGCTVAAATFCAGGVSGCALNPAVGVGPVAVHALMGDGSFADLWLYIVGPVVGALLAVPVFRLQNPE